jgi:two-component system response regulator (stage 0 sporulation protein F)
VDDDSGTCETLSDVLETMDFKPTCVNSGEECLKLLKKRDFDTVLMDVKMQGKSGVETFIEIKKMNKKIRVVMMTAYGDNDIVNLAIHEGAASVVHKPLDLDQLISML